MGKKLLISKSIAERDFNQFFDSERQMLINQCIQTGYDLVNDYCKKAPEWLALNGRGKRMIPEFKNSAVEFAIMQASKRKILPFLWSVEENAGKTGTYLKLTYNGACFTVNQTRNIDVCSRDAQFRQNLLDEYVTRLNLFDQGETATTIKHYFEINHGYQSKHPLFTVAGIPDGNHGWIFSKQLNRFTALSKGEDEDLKTVSKDISDFGEDEFKDYLQGKI